MKKIMILGAGIYQVPLIKKAKENGLFTIVVSIPGEYPGFSYADKICYVDTTDYKTVLEIAKAEKIDGICTTGTDVAVYTIGYICDDLGLKGISKKAANYSTDKIAMKRCFLDNGVTTAKFKELGIDDAYEQVLSSISEIGYPLVFKAVDSSGSRGITIVREENNVREAIERIRKTTKSNFYIIEEFIEGEEFGAQAFVADGKIKFVMTHGDYIYHGNTGVPIGHFVPFGDKELEETVYDEISKVVKAFDLSDCAINADFILRDGKVYVLEIGARAGATCLPELVSLFYDVDYYSYILDSAIGKENNTRFLPGNKCVGCKLLINEKGGLLTNIVNTNNMDEIDSIEFDYEIGQKIPSFKVGPDRLGQFILTAKTIEELEDKISLVDSNISFVVEE